MITIVVNEQKESVLEGMTAGELRDRVKPDADLLIVNSFPGTPTTILKDGDKIVLIKRGEIPKPEELEALMVSRHSPGVHDRMKKATVGIAGLGGLGSAVAISLARVGIGTLILVDFDIVEPSNLNRQHYAIEHIGIAKTDAMIRILTGINPYIRLQPHNVLLDRDNVPRIFKDADIVVECFDRAESKAMIIQTVSESLPEAVVIGASGLAGYGDSNSIHSRQLGDRIFLVGDFTKAAQPGRGLMAPRVGIAAHHQSNLVLSLLMDRGDLEL